MATNPRTLSALIKYGPVVYGLAREHAPELVEQARRAGILGDETSPSARGTTGQGPSGSSPRARSRQRHGLTRFMGDPDRRAAMSHARAVVDGSALETWDAGERVWVVFSGREPVGTHPHVATPYATLLRHADLTRAIRPVKADRRGEEPGSPTATRPGTTR